MTMEPRYDHKSVESKIYKMWEDGGYFKATRDPAKKPYTIVLPLPNASGKMHVGNVLMIAIEDLLIRWKRMQGYSALWVPGTDHAGFETQVTYERELKKQGKSRFDFDRATLYQQIWDFVHENKHLIEGQIKEMGASVDWSRYLFSLDQRSLEMVFNTFSKMLKDGLIYRDDYIVNYCPALGTTFADLEVTYEERNDPLYYVKYKLLGRQADEPEFVACATVRPELIFIDTHLAVNPKDKKNAWLIGRKVSNPLTGVDMDIIGDGFVDPKFGTGVVKLTPAHDKVDYSVAIKHRLPIRNALDLRGRINEKGGKYAGMKIKEARKAVYVDLQEADMLEKVDEKYIHTVPVSYKGSADIEPLVLPNWFVKVESLRKPALEAVTKGEVTIYPKWRKITYIRWMEEMRDWPISRQVVWGIRIPAWYNVDDNPDLLISFKTNTGEVKNGFIKELLKDFAFEEIEAGLQTLIAGKESKFIISKEKVRGRFLQETDTFDTWFSSGQWPLTTLGYPDSDDFKYFYPTDVLETAWEILRLWVSRMIMFGIYLTGKPPFKDVYLHGIVKAMDGRKMSKSLGNVINPDEYLQKYGADALRMGLISGTANGKDFAFPQDKVIAYRNFANKIWNMARFFLMEVDKFKESTGKDLEFYNDEINSLDMGGQKHNEISQDSNGNQNIQSAELTELDKKMLDDLNQLIKSVDQNLAKYRFADASEAIYHFMWDELASKYLEDLKIREDKKIALRVFRHIFMTCLKLLHPFMPFITEEVWSYLPKKTSVPLVSSSWPRV